MSNITDYLRNSLLNYAFGVASYAQPVTLYAGLFTILPTTNSDPGTEVSASGYQRVAATWSPASVGLISNGADVRFPATGTTTSNWGAILGVGLYDALINGNLLWYGPISASVSLLAGNFFQVATNDLTISLS